jgi:hypothetical protein
MVWPPHRYCVWPCQVRQKYSCTVRSIGGLRHSPPWMKNHGLNEEKPYRRYNNLSIESSEVNVWLVWILTTKSKSLKRVETCQKDHFTFWLFVMLTRSSVLIFQTVFTLWIYIYIHVIFSTLNPWLFIRIWMMLFLSRIWKKPRLCLVDYTHTPYSFCLLKCTIIPLGSFDR